MEGIVFTLEGLQGSLGEHYFVKQSRQGNFQVNLKDIRSYSDDDKVTMLYRARQKLQAAGLDASIKLTYRNQGTGRFENWPCIWVDRGRIPQLTDVRNVTRMIQRVFALLEQQGIEVPENIITQFGTGDEFEDERESEPDETSFEGAAAIRRRQEEISEGIGIRKPMDPAVRGPTLNVPSPGVGSPRLPGSHEKPFGE